MKKLLGIIAIGLLLSSNSFANLDELNITIKDTNLESQIVKPNKAYRQSCSTQVSLEGNIFDMEHNSYIAVKGKKQFLIGELVFDLPEEYGKFILTTEEKIKPDGTLAKIKSKTKYTPDYESLSKKELKQLTKIFKFLGEELSNRVINYGEKIKPGTQRVDGSKEFKRTLKKMEQFMFEDEDPKTVKEIIKFIKDETDFELVKEYLGTTELNGEKFYLVRWNGNLNYKGDIAEVKNAFATLNSTDVIHFIHAESGYRSATKMTSKDPGDDMIIEMLDDLVCTIYKNKEKPIEISLYDFDKKRIKQRNKIANTNTKVEDVLDLNNQFMCVHYDKYETSIYEFPLSYSATYKFTKYKNSMKSGSRCGLKIELEKNKESFDKFKSYWEQNKDLVFFAEIPHGDVIKFIKGTFLENEYVEIRKSWKK